MALINHVKKEINAKIVFFGPASAGKATNLNHIFSKLKETFRGTFKSMNMQNDKMLFFDFIPSGQGTLNGYTIRFHVYTMTGEVTRPSSWKMVLKGVDGVVFVADSDPARMDANLESLRLLDSSLGSFGKSIADISFAIQCNKRDLSDAAPMEEMGRVLNPRGFIMVPAVARQGEGVLESIFNLARMVMKNLKERGLELDRQTEQFHRMAKPSGATISEAIPVEEEDLTAAADESSAMPGDAEKPAVFAEAKPARGDEPVVAFAGEPEILRNGRLRLPLTIRYEGKEKKIALDISLLQERD